MSCGHVTSQRLSDNCFSSGSEGEKAASSSEEEEEALSGDDFGGGGRRQQPSEQASAELRRGDVFYGEDHRLRMK